MDKPATIANESSPPFGAYPPGPWRDAVIGFTRSTPESWLGRRLAFGARRLAFAPNDRPLDIEIEGVKFRLMRRGNLCEKRLMFTPQYFDAEELKILRQDIGAKTGRPYVFFDIGANVGAYSLFAASWSGPAAKIFAFEPQPHIHERLVANIQFNPFETISPQRLALADSDEPMTFFIDETNSGESSLKKLETLTTTREIQVPAMRLLSFVQKERLEHISAMKLDVEGAEDLILAPFFADAPDELLPSLIIVENARQRWQRDIISDAHARGYRTDMATRMNIVLRR